MLNKSILVTALLSLSLGIYASVGFSEEQSQKLDYTTSVKNGKLVLETKKCLMAAPFLAHILPLPGSFDGFVMNDKSFVGLNIKEDDTRNSMAEMPKLDDASSSASSDIMFTCNKESLIVTAESNDGLRFPLILPTPSSANQAMSINWEEGLLLMTQYEERRAVFSGCLSMPIADAKTKKVLYILDYCFAKGSYAKWQKDSKKYQWANIDVKKRVMDGQ